MGDASGSTVVVGQVQQQLHCQQLYQAQQHQQRWAPDTWIFDARGRGRVFSAPAMHQYGMGTMMAQWRKTAPSSS